MRGSRRSWLGTVGRVGAKATAALAALQLAAAGALAAQGGIPALFPERPAGFVTDVAGVVDAASARTMTARIERLRDSTGAEIAVVTLPRIGEYAPVDVAVAIGRAWGVGAQAAIGEERRNAGVVVLLVPRRAEDPNSGHIFIASGQGVEGIITDAAAGRVRDEMIPYLARGDYGPGLLVGVEALAGRLERAMSGLPPEEDGGGRIPVVVIVLVVLVVVAVVIAIAGASSEAAAPSTVRRRGRRRRTPWWMSGGGFGGGSGGFGGGGFGGGGFGGFGGGGGFSGGGAGGRF